MRDQAIASDDLQYNILPGKDPYLTMYNNDLEISSGLN